MVWPLALLLLTAAADGSPLCRNCHRDLYDRYALSPMGRSFYKASGAALIEDWTVQNRLDHAASSRSYDMFRRDGRIFVRRGGLELRVDFIVGSGTRARTYLHQTPEGRLIELPVSWYTQEKRWAMAPGYDRANHPDFSRTVNHKCMFCHNAYPDVPAARARPGWDDDVRFPAQLPLGINCERCHGDGTKHARDGSPASIVNPVKLSRERQMDVCMQCHLETTSFRLPDSLRRFGRGFYSFLPGEALGDYAVYFDHAPGSGHEDKFEIVSAAYRLRQSACFLKSGTMTCGTCHNPHRAVDVRAQCLGCHTQPHTAGGNCITCHMPLRRTEDVVHVAMTDHRIAKGPFPGDLLAPRREKTEAEQVYRGGVVQYYPAAGDTLYLAVAQVKEKANLPAGVPMLAEFLAARPVPHAEPYFELAEAQAVLGLGEDSRRSYAMALERDPEFVQAANNLGNLLAAAGRFGEAIPLYRRAVALDPGSAETLRNLGLTLRDAGDAAGAERALRDATRAYPLFAAAWRDLGSLLLSQGQLAAAREPLERALLLDHTDVKTQNNLGLAFWAMGERARARPYLEYTLRHGDRAAAALARKLLETR